MKIHATAAVDEGAVLANDVEIGPFAVVGSDVVVGAGTVIQSHAVIEGRVRIGAGNTIGHGSVIGGLPQDLRFDPEARSSVEIGDGNVIREHCTIHRGTADGSATTVGNKNFLMAGAHIGHNCRVGDDVIIANNALLGGYVSVDDRAFIGGATTFHQNVRVGRLAMVQGSSAFSKDIPPFLLAAERNFVVGVNVLGLRRASMTAAERDEIKRAFKLLYRSGLNVRQAIDKAAENKFGPFGREFFEFVTEAKKRGIAAYRHGGEEP
ncbi:MAG: acyl-ACP--UDP-N-acetylglucosamine O-acyltransferase [Chthoniobacterales bacterium]|nr:acyl-ACP--UDP-N-acetylglucosamine O-acyltransferase [Chthoniobacterales bacterium]